MRKHSSSQRAQTRATMTTEYQERFLHPRCHTAVVSTSTRKDPCHPLKATSSDTTTFKSYCVTHKWISNPQPFMLPKGHHFGANQVASKVDYTSVYKSDFQARKAERRQPFKLQDSLNVKQGLVVPNSASKEGRSQINYVQVAASQAQRAHPFESITSYRYDYVTHPVQPTARRVKPVDHPSKGLPFEPAESLRPKVTSDIHQEFYDKASEFFQQFKTWSHETKFRGQGTNKESNPQAHQRFLSTTHADYTAHQHKHTKPVLPSWQTSEKRKSLQATTTMKEGPKGWDTPQCFPSVHNEELDWPKKTTFSVCTPKPAESYNTDPKPLSLHPKLNKATVCNSRCNATEKPQCPAENGRFSGFECISTRNEESQRYWTTSLHRGGTWPNGDIWHEPSEAHQIISCTVSSRS